MACAPSTAHAAQIAFDSAGDSAYNNGWANGSNGGFGWGGGWTVPATIPGLPAFAIIGDSTTNGHGDPDGDGDINSPRAVGGRAWGLLGGGAIRTFSGPLSVGQTFALDFDDYGAANTNFNSSIFLLAPDGSVALRFQANGTGGHYVISTNSAFVDTGVADTDQGIHLAFTQLSSRFRSRLTLPGPPPRLISCRTPAKPRALSSPRPRSALRHPSSPRTLTTSRSRRSRRAG